MKKQLMSIAAIAALFTTGIHAFDATQGDGQLIKETGATTAVLGTYNNTNAAVPAADALQLGAPGEIGDALIYPAFFGGHNFSTEFSVINVNPDEAVIAKVVLYSAKDSKELKDFNIYLSANDVFRATIKDGKIISTDGSTVVPGTDHLSTVGDHGYNYLDSSVMASKNRPFETSVDEDIGYIAVFAMVQTDEDGTAAKANPSTNVAYHKKHNALWRDYRHLLDQCRSENWRDGITNGIYTGNDAVNQPNIDLAANAIAGVHQNANTCDTIPNTVLSTKATGPQQIKFKSPERTLTGTLVVKGSDSKGTRAMTLKATPIRNYSTNTRTVLWTEGELASISDRCITFNAAGNTHATANYDAECINRDVANNMITGTLYEFGSLESQLLVTQPWKRTLIQMNGDGGAIMPGAAAYSGVTRQPNNKGNGIAAGTTTPANDFNVVNYGGFKITQTVYNDDEDQYIGTAGGFTVSPASTAAADVIPNEMTMFNPLPGGASYPKGYAVINFKNGGTANESLHGIVTQMTANEVDGTAEINWLYPLTF